MHHEQGFIRRHPVASTFAMIGAAALGVGNGIASAHIASPAFVGPISASASVEQAHVTDLTGINLECFGQYTVSASVQAEGKLTLLPSLPLSSLRTAKTSVTYNPTEAPIATVYTCFTGDSIKMTVNPNAQRFHGGTVAPNQDPVITMSVSKSDLTTILSPVRGVNPDEFQRSNDNFNAFVAEGVAAGVKLLAPNDRGPLKSLDGDTLQNILESFARETAYETAEGSCTNQLLTNAVTRAAIIGFLEKQAVTQFNHDHAKDGITTYDVAVNWSDTGTAKSSSGIDQNNLSSTIAADKANIATTRSSLGGSVQFTTTAPIKSAKCELAKPVVSRAEADVVPLDASQTNSASPQTSTPNVTNTASAAPTPRPSVRSLISALPSARETASASSTPTGRP